MTKNLNSKIKKFELFQILPMLKLPANSCELKKLGTLNLAKIISFHHGVHMMENWFYKTFTNLSNMHE